MAQHFLQSAKARSLSLASVAQLSDDEAADLFAKIRWPDTNGEPVCPHCGSPSAYRARRANGMLRFRCKGCRKDFTLTSGTIIGHHKLPLKTILLAVTIFCNEVKGKSSMALSRDLDVHGKTAFVLAHKLREAMARERRADQANGGALPSKDLLALRFRQSIQGHHHHVEDQHFERYVMEQVWRDGHRRKSNGDQVLVVTKSLLTTGPRSAFVGYWQRPTKGRRKKAKSDMKSSEN